MLLAVDVGNTNIVLGVYEGRDLKAHWRIRTDRERVKERVGYCPDVGGTNRSTSRSFSGDRSSM